MDAVENPQFINDAAKLFGSQSIVVSIDVKKVSHGYEIFIKNGQIGTGLESNRIFDKNGRHGCRRTIYQFN